MDRDRGQTTIDFAIGASIFLLTLAFVFAFVPGMLVPFSSPQGNTLVADRVAQQLAIDVLAEPSDPHVLDDECTEAYFTSDSSPADCDYASVHDSVGVSDDWSLNVELRNGDTVVFAKGESAPSSGTITAKRAVYYGGETHVIYVRAW